MGKRKCYKQAYGKGSAEDAKRFKYSGQAIHSKDSTRGFLFSYRRGKLKPAMREAFNTIKYFTELIHPGSVEPKSVEENKESVPENDDPLDVEAELLKEAKQEKVKDERMFHIFETGIEQTFFMEMRSDFDSTEITDRMWEDILSDKVGNNVLAPRCIERVLPINNVCVANKERIKEVLSNLIDVKFPKLNEPSEYYIMPRVRFHPSIERDHLLEIARETMKEKRPECQLNWKNYSTIIFLEVLKKNCYIGIFTEWTNRTKYNWQEHHKRKTESSTKNKPENAEAKSTTEATENTETVAVTESKAPEVIAKKK